MDVPTTMIGSIHATDDGRVRFHPQTIRTAGVPAKGLMDTLGLKVDKLVQGTDPRGVENGRRRPHPRPGTAPAPAPRPCPGDGRARGRRPHRDDLRPQARGRAPPPELTPPDAQAASYMYFRGGTIRFRKLTMADTDLQMVDAHPGDPLDFSIGRYYEQLVAGYSKNTPAGGPVTVVPDFRPLRRKGNDDDNAPAATPDLCPPPPAEDSGGR